MRLLYFRVWKMKSRQALKVCQKKILNLIFLV